MQGVTASQATNLDIDFLGFAFIDLFAYTT